MKANRNSLTPLQAEWEGVVRMRDRIRQLTLSTWAVDANRSPAFGDVLYNLPLHLAFGVLKKALLQARAEGQFTTPRQHLSDLMENAKTALE
jgi:hypothetical protein